MLPEFLILREAIDAIYKIPPNHCDCAMADNEKSERKEEKEQHQDVELLTWYKKIVSIHIAAAKDHKRIDCQSIS